MDRTLLGVSDACKQINRIVQRAQTDDLYGAAVDPVTGEFLFLMLLRWFSFYEFDAVQPLSIRSKCASVCSCISRERLSDPVYLEQSQ